jgi:hypothetical protein
MAGGWNFFMTNRRKWISAVLGVAALLAGTNAGGAVTVEFLQAAIAPQTAGLLSGLACRNLDHIVHLDLSVTWPATSLAVETDGYRRLIFWNESENFCFRKAPTLCAVAATPSKVTSLRAPGVFIRASCRISSRKPAIPA